MKHQLIMPSSLDRLRNTIIEKLSAISDKSYLIELNKLVENTDMIKNDLNFSSHLNEQQILMLQMFKNPLPEKDFVEIRRLAVKLLSKKLDEIVGDWEKQNDITEKSYDKLSKGHFRSK